MKKYTELSLLKQFLSSFDTSVFNEMQKANQVIDTSKASKKKKKELQEKKNKLVSN